MTGDALLDLVGSTRNGVLVTLERDGRPQLSDVTHRYDPDRRRVVRLPVGRVHGQPPQ